MARRVFLVEDEPIIASGIVRKLEQLGYAVTGRTGTGESAVRLVDSNPPDLVLMDIKLDGRMDGIETAGEIRRRHDIPIVFLTAFADEATVGRATQQEPFGYVVKPFTDRELSGAIEVALHRHALDKAIRAREQRYRMLSEVLSDYAFSIRIAPDTENDELEWSVGSEAAVFGVKLDGFRTIEDALYLVHPEDAPVVSSFWQRLRSGKDGKLEFRVMPGDGSVRWVKMDGKVVAARNGAVERVYGAYQNITELRRTQDRLAQREFEFSQIVQTVNQGIWVGDGENVCIFVNQALCELTGYPRDQLVGRESLSSLLSGAPEVGREEQESQPFESELNTRDRGQIPMLVTPRIIRGDDGTLHGSFYLFVDISSQRRALEVVERGRRKLEGVFHASPAPSLLIDSGSNAVIDVNEAFTRATGFAPEEIVGTGGFGLAEYEKLEDLNRMVALLKERTEQTSQIRLRTKDGEPRLYEVEVRDIVVEDEEVLMLILRPAL
jgi:PAS domain S-box-containing protein